MSQFSSDLQSVHSQCGKKSIYVFQEPSVTFPLNPSCTTNIRVLQRCRLHQTQTSVCNWRLWEGPPLTTRGRIESYTLFIHTYFHLEPSSQEVHFLSSIYSGDPPYSTKISAYTHLREQTQLPEPLFCWGILMHSQGCLGHQWHSLKTRRV